MKVRLEKKEKTPRKKRARAWELDALRGLAILLVIWDHVMFSVGHLFYIDGWEYSSSEFLNAFGTFALDYWDSELRVYGWPVFVFIFFFVSGVCTGFSGNNFLRGLRLALVALAVSLATYILDYVIGFSGTFIQFGVLHCLALSILLFAVLSLVTNLLDRVKYGRFIKAGIYLAIAAALLAVNYTYNITLYEVNTTNLVVPDYTPITGMFLFTRDWWTADYFPLLPFFGFFMIGAAVAPAAYPKGKSLLPALDGKWNRFLTVPGKYSLYIYLGIQVVAVALLWLLTLAVTGETYFF